MMQRMLGVVGTWLALSGAAWADIPPPVMVDTRDPVSMAAGVVIAGALMGGGVWLARKRRA